MSLDKFIDFARNKYFGGYLNEKDLYYNVIRLAVIVDEETTDETIMHIEKTPFYINFKDKNIKKPKNIYNASTAVCVNYKDFIEYLTTFECSTDQAVEKRLIALLYLIYIIEEQPAYAKIYAKLNLDKSEYIQVMPTQFDIINKFLY